MKKIIYLLFAISCIFIGCDNDEWSDGDPSMEHVYYVGFQQWTARFDNSAKYDINRTDTVGIPIQFYSERVRSYDVTTYYYVSGSLIRGVDYEVVDQNKTVLNPNENGAFSLIWPKAVKGIQRVYIKALNSSTGSFTVLTFDPNSAVPISSSDVSTTTNNKTQDYEVRAFSQNYKVTVNIK